MHPYTIVTAVLLPGLAYFWNRSSRRQLHLGEGGSLVQTTKFAVTGPLISAHGLPGAVVLSSKREVCLQNLGPQAAGLICAPYPEGVEGHLTTLVEPRIFKVELELGGTRKLGIETARPRFEEEPADDAGIQVASLLENGAAIAWNNEDPVAVSDHILPGDSLVAADGAWGAIAVRSAAAGGSVKKVSVTVSRSMGKDKPVLVAAHVHSSKTTTIGLYGVQGSALKLLGQPVNMSIPPSALLAFGVRDGIEIYVASPSSISVLFWNGSTLQRRKEIALPARMLHRLLSGVAALDSDGHVTLLPMELNKEPKLLQEGALRCSLPITSPVLAATSYANSLIVAVNDGIVGYSVTKSPNDEASCTVTELTATGDAGAAFTTLQSYLASVGVPSCVARCTTTVLAGSIAHPGARVDLPPGLLLTQAGHTGSSGVDSIVVVNTENGQATLHVLSASLVLNNYMKILLLLSAVMVALMLQAWRRKRQVQDKQATCVPCKASTPEPPKVEKCKIEEVQEEEEDDDIDVAPLSDSEASSEDWQALQYIFDRFDTGNNGRLTLAECREIWSLALGQWCPTNSQWTKWCKNPTEGITRREFFSALKDKSGYIAGLKEKLEDQARKAEAAKVVAGAAAVVEQLQNVVNAAEYQVAESEVIIEDVTEKQKVPEELHEKMMQQKIVDVTEELEALEQKKSAAKDVVSDDSSHKGVKIEEIIEDESVEQKSTTGVADQDWLVVTPGLSEPMRIPGSKSAKSRRSEYVDELMRKNTRPKAKPSATQTPKEEPAAPKVQPTAPKVQPAAPKVQPAAPPILQKSPAESTTTSVKTKDQSAAKHTYDVGYKKWENLDVDKLEAEVDKKMEDSGKSKPSTVRKTAADKPLPEPVAELAAAVEDMKSKKKRIDEANKPLDARAEVQSTNEGKNDTRRTDEVRDDDSDVDMQDGPPQCEDTEEAKERRRQLSEQKARESTHLKEVLDEKPKLLETAPPKQVVVKHPNSKWDDFDVDAALNEIDDEELKKKGLSEDEMKKEKVKRIVEDTSLGRQEMKEKVCKVLGREVPEETEEDKRQEGKDNFLGMMMDPRRSPEEKAGRFAVLSETGELKRIGVQGQTEDVDPQELKSKAADLKVVASKLALELKAIDGKEDVDPERMRKLQETMAEAERICPGVLEDNPTAKKAKAEAEKKAKAEAAEKRKQELEEEAKRKAEEETTRFMQRQHERKEREEMEKRLKDERQKKKEERKAKEKAEGKDAKSGGDYFKRWDHFDVDDALVELDSDEEERREQREKQEERIRKAREERQKREAAEKAAADRKAQKEAQRLQKIKDEEDAKKREEEEKVAKKAAKKKEIAEMRARERQVLRECNTGLPIPLDADDARKANDNDKAPEPEAVRRFQNWDPDAALRAVDNPELDQSSLPEAEKLQQYLMQVAQDPSIEPTEKFETYMRLVSKAKARGDWPPPNPIGAKRNAPRTMDDSSDSD